jgi:uncharacterized membrane protein YfcA
VVSGGFALALLAAAGAGAVNALAGGGTLLLFPALLALGIPAVAASAHSTVALCPGYFGATLAQRAELAGQRERLGLLLPAAVLGGVLGGALLLATGEAGFRAAIPWLLLGASLLLAAQGPLRARWSKLAAHSPHDRRLPALVIGAASVYGGYFGAGLSVILLALLGLLLSDTLTRLNALKQAAALAANVGAAAFFIVRAPLQWPLLAALAVAALAGGWLGGRLASRVPGALLRVLVVALGLLLAAYYFYRDIAHVA